MRWGPTGPSTPLFFGGDGRAVRPAYYSTTFDRIAFQ